MVLAVSRADQRYSSEFMIFCQGLVAHIDKERFLVYRSQHRLYTKGGVEMNRTHTLLAEIEQQSTPEISGLELKRAMRERGVRSNFWHDQSVLDLWDKGWITRRHATQEESPQMLEGSVFPFFYSITDAGREALEDPSNFDQFGSLWSLIKRRLRQKFGNAA